MKNNIIHMLSGALLATVLTGSPLSANAAEIFTPKAVVELFTSQGCSSCPPADAILKTFNEGRDILGLAFHVDYWNSLGWKDTFSDAEFTSRQRKYAQAMNERSVYTPQAVVNGRKHVVGSRKSQIVDLASKLAKSGEGMTVPIKVSETNGRLNVSISPQSGLNDATLYAVYFQPRAKVKIERGENSGRTITYSNIVRKVEMIGMADANGMKAGFSLADLKAKGFEGCALILQSKTKTGMPGAIMGATVIGGI